MSRFVAAYDVSDNSRRTQVSKILLRYGDRLQKSVFEIWLDPDELPEIRRLVGPLLSEGDLFELIPVDLAPNRQRWRWGTPFDEHPPVIVLGR